MTIFKNPLIATGIDTGVCPPSTDITRPLELLRQCPVHQPTPLIEWSPASDWDVRRLSIKDERQRMGLGAFKALGAAYVIADDATKSGDPTQKPLKDRTYVTASAGNHGMSVAAGARVFGARAVVYLAKTVPEAFAELLREKGAEVRFEGEDYEASMDAALAAARENGWTLLSDQTFPEDFATARKVIEGYGVIMQEVGEQVDEAPTHILLQAGVGGLAGASAAYARKLWGNEVEIIVVEPDKAPCLLESVRAGHATMAGDGVSNMGRLDCKEPNLSALAGLSLHANVFMTISDEEAENVLPKLAARGLASTPSGAAALAALGTGKLDLPKDAHVLAILSEAEIAL